MRTDNVSVLRGQILTLKKLLASCAVLLTDSELLEKVNAALWSMNNLPREDNHPHEDAIEDNHAHEDAIDELRA